MVEDLARSQNMIIGSLKDALEVVQKVNDEVTAGLLIDRMGVHEKAAWMLKSTAV